MSGEPPFDGKNEYEIMQKVLKGPVKFSSMIWKSISNEGKDIVQKMLSYGHDKRMSA